MTSEAIRRSWPLIRMGMLAATLAAVSAWRILGPGRDWVGGYDAAFEWARTINGLDEIKNFRLLDPGFAFLLYLIGRIPNCPDGTFLALIGLLSISPKLWCFSRYAPNSAIAIAVHLSLFYVVHDYTQLRAGLAIGLMMLAIALVGIERRRIMGLLLGLAAASVHLSSAIMLPFSVILRASWRFWAGIVALALLSGTGLNVLSNFSDRLAGYISYAYRYDVPNPVSSLKLYQYLTMALFFYYRGEISSRGWIMVEAAGWLLVVGVAFFFGLSSVPVLANRTSELFTAFMPFLVSGLALLLPRAFALPYVTACLMIGLWGSYRILA